MKHPLLRLPDSVVLEDVTLRDGLQGVKRRFPLQEKLCIAEGLGNSGVKRIQIGAFVNPEMVPQMADTSDISTPKQVFALTRSPFGNRGNPYLPAPPRHPWNRPGQPSGRAGGGETLYNTSVQDWGMPLHPGTNREHRHGKRRYHVGRDGY